jgi:hypothetical protein
LLQTSAGTMIEAQDIRKPPRLVRCDHVVCPPEQNP